MLRSLSVTAPKDGRVVEFEREFGGDTLAEKAAVYGEKVVCSLFDQMATIKCAGVVRAALKARTEAGDFENTDEEAISIGLAYVPSAGAERKLKDIYAGIIAKINSGETTREEAVKELKARLAQLEGK